MTRVLFLLAALTFGFTQYVCAGEPPDWFRREPAKAAAAADLILIAKIRDVTVLSGKTGRPLKKLPEYVDERYQGQLLRFTLEYPRVLWPSGGSSQNELTVSMDGITATFVASYKTSTVVLLLAKQLKAKALLYTPAGYWPIADIKDLETIQKVIATRAAETKTKHTLFKPALPLHE